MNEVTFSTKYGPMTCFKNDIVFVSHLSQGKIYEEEYVVNKVIPMIQPIPGKKVILDIGGHIGSHTVLYSKLIGDCEIHTFEAQSRMYQLLEKNIKQNRITNCTLHHNAVGHVCQSTTMSNMLYDGYDCVIEYDTPKIFNYGGIGLGQNGEQVDMITIDSLKLSRCDYMKIDVEGAEILVLMGAIETLQTYRPMIWFEASDKTVSPEMKTSMKIEEDLVDVTTFLQQLGYEFLTINEGNVLARHRETSKIPIELSTMEKTLYSESGEDGILFTLFQIFGLTNRFYVEFGAEDGSQCNTRALNEFAQFRGVLFDMNYENPAMSLYKHTITTENVIGLFERYQVPKEFDLLSVDIDSHDFYVLHKILKHYKPRVFVCEYNATHLPEEDKVVLETATQFQGNYFGASILAFHRLGQYHNYSLVYANKKGVNLFFVRNDVLKQSIYTVPHINDVAAIYNTPKYGKGPNGGHPADPLNQEYTSSEAILQIYHL